MLWMICPVFSSRKCFLCLFLGLIYPARRGVHDGIIWGVKDHLILEFFHWHINCAIYNNITQSQRRNPLHNTLLPEYSPTLNKHSEASFDSNTHLWMIEIQTFFTIIQVWSFIWSHHCSGVGISCISIPMKWKNLWITHFFQRAEFKRRDTFATGADTGRASNVASNPAGPSTPQVMPVSSLTVVSAATSSAGFVTPAQRNSSAANAHTAAMTVPLTTPIAAAANNLLISWILQLLFLKIRDCCRIFNTGHAFTARTKRLKLTYAVDSANPWVRMDSILLQPPSIIRAAPILEATDIGSEPALFIAFCAFFASTSIAGPMRCIRTSNVFGSKRYSAVKDLSWTARFTRYSSSHRFLKKEDLLMALPQLSRFTTNSMSKTACSSSSSNLSRSRLERARMTSRIVFLCMGALSTSILFTTKFNPSDTHNEAWRFEFDKYQFF